MEEPTKVKLNLACGKMYLPGWINIDNKSMYDGNMKVDIEADILNLQWEKGTVDEIFLCHFLMYVHLTKLPDLLARWYDWLKPDGFITITTGDIKKIAKYILEHNDPEELNTRYGVRQLYGWETTAGHKWAWCFETLEPILREVGFKNIQVIASELHYDPIRDTCLTASK